MKKKSAYKLLSIYSLILVPTFFFEYSIIPKFHNNDLTLLASREGVSGVDTFLQETFGYSFVAGSDFEKFNHIICNRDEMFDGNFYTNRRFGLLCFGGTSSTTYDFGWISFNNKSPLTDTNKLIHTKNKQAISCSEATSLKFIYKMQSSIYRCSSKVGDGKEYDYSVIYIYPAKIKSITPVIVVGTFEGKESLLQKETDIIQKITYIHF